MRPFAIKKAAVSVLCHGSYNSLNDKRYNAVFIRITPVIYADRLQERRSTIPLNTELMRWVSVAIILFVLDFISSRF